MSWQLGALKSYLWLHRLYVSMSKDWDIKRQRDEWVKMTRLSRPLCPIEQEPVIVDGVPGLWLTSASTAENRVIFYLHGGGYCLGSIQTEWPLAGNIGAAARARVLMIEYRLAPEHPFPAAVQDALAAFRWLQTAQPESRIAVVGTSAGGGLALALAVALRDAGEPLPAALACLSPWTDLALTGTSHITRAKSDLLVTKAMGIDWSKAYLGTADPKDPLASPLYADLNGLPPLLIQVGTDEIVLDDSTRLAERARAAGVDVSLQMLQGGQHMLQASANLVPEARQAVTDVGAFLDPHLAGSAEGQPFGNLEAVGIAG